MCSLFGFSLLVLLVALGECSIHGTTRNGDLSAQQPTIVEVDLQSQNLASILASAKTEQSESARQRRQAQPDEAPPGFGTTVVLEGDPHTFALVHWSGQPKQRIFILTRERDSDGYSIESFLYISYDYGKSFTNVTNKFPNGTVLEWYWISSNADILIFADRIHRQLYVTMDEGDTFHGYNISFVPQDRNAFQFQFSRVSNVESYRTYVLGYDKTAQSLWVTSNVNDSEGWHKLGDDVTRYAWRQLNSTYEDPSAVYFDMKINDTAAQLFRVNFNGQKWTQNSLFSSALGVFSPGSFVLSYQYMFVQRNYTDIGIDTPIEYQSPLWVSTYRKGFNQARFPLKVEEKHYATVDASENQVFIAVYHVGESLNGTAVTNLYLSEEAGLNYSLSLENVVSAEESDWVDGYPTFDVYVVEALVGTYIANRKSASGDDYSVISFDKGGEWRPITPPTLDSDGLPLICNLPCSLHFHMYLDEANGVQPILSQESAPGVLMGLGNIGTSLTSDTSSLRLYLSTNGGVSWSELASGYNEFQLLDFGVFMAYTNKNSLSSKVWWTCNEGVTWNNYTYTDHSIWVVRMLTENGEKAQHATIFGYYPFNFFSFEWLVIDLDFTTLNLSQCNSSDYYSWQPTDERSDQQCILGENFVYERRLPGHCCYINATYDRPVNRTSCSCTTEDFECDFGFERTDLDGPCAPQPGFVYPPFVPTNCPEGDTYSYTSGYRRISGDKCIMGNDTTFGPIVENCPEPAPLGLVISTSENYYHVGPVDFTLTQTQGAVIVTQYTWDFGDNSTVMQIVGLAQASPITHNYYAPNTYTVTMTATDQGGQGVAQKEVKVLDKMTGLVIATTQPLTPTFVYTYINLYVNISTQNGTQLLGEVFYIWTVNGSNIGYGYGVSSIIHSFLTVGVATVGVDVSNPIDHKYQEFKITVGSAPSLFLSVSLTGTEPASSIDYVPTHAQVYLSVFPTAGQFPSDAKFRWIVQPLTGNGTIYDNETQADTITVVFPNVGDYYIYVTETIGTVTVHLDHIVTAEEALGVISNVSGLAPGYRINSNVSLTISLQSTENLPYSGIVWVSGYLCQPGSMTSLVSLLLTVQEGQARVGFPLTSEGTYSFIVFCENEVSRVNTTRPTFVADRTEYQYLRFIFNTSLLPSEYSSDAWQLALKESVTSTLLEQLTLEEWQLEVSVDEEADSNSNSVEYKRQSSSSETIIVAHVYLLPDSLQEADVDSTAQAASQLIEEANNGSISFVVNNKTVTVTSADTGPQFIIVDGGDGGNYLPLVIGLSVGGFAVVLILVILVILAIIYWKKKYRKLEVRYTRLRQGPMRFTFTAEGETLEEEDYPNSDEDTDDENDVEDAYKMSGTT